MIVIKQARLMGLAKEKYCGVTYCDSSNTYNGYTLFAPLGGFWAWLIDMQGKIVHAWKMPYRPGQHGVLLPDGNLLYLGRSQDQRGPEQGLGGFGGKLLIADWDSNVIWEHKNDYMHHDCWPMKNGNFLILIWSGLMPREVRAKIKGGVPKSFMEGTRIGGPGTTSKEEMWTGSILEITPEKKVVWEWKEYEHLDPELDIINPLDWPSEWTHTNSVQELPNGDILISTRSLSSLYIIDRNTGDVKWRWGPGELAHQHDATMVENGNIICFDNGMGRPNTELKYSRVVEVDPKTNKIVWEYKDNPPNEFYSAIQGGCQRLPNGNTLITESTRGRIFEVTHDGEIVWEFVNPCYGWDLGPGWWNGVRRVYRYGPDYEGLKGKTLDAKKFNWLNKVYGLDKMRTEESMET